MKYVVLGFRQPRSHALSLAFLALPGASMSSWVD
jgi:hypothetical protein